MAAVVFFRPHKPVALTGSWKRTKTDGVVN